MSSPFPGMDPYLEGEMWQEFHETLAGAIRAQIMPLLAPKYVALLAKRYVLARPTPSIMGLPPERITSTRTSTSMRLPARYLLRRSEG